MSHQTKTTPIIPVKDLVLTALMAAVICVVSPWSLSLGPIPFSLSIFAIYLSVYILGWKRGTLATAIYLLIGLVGLPVFSGFSGGPQKLFGPTGGFLLGYLPMAVFIGVFLEKLLAKRLTLLRRLLCILAVFAGTMILYLFGSIWYAFQAGVDFGASFAVCAAPFLLIDLVKNILANLIGPAIRSRIFRDLPRAVD